MNKNIFIFILVVLTLQTISAYSIGYIVNNPDKLDSNELAIMNFLISEKNSVALLDDITSNVNNYDIVIVSDSVNKINFNNIYYKTLFLSKNAAKEKGLAGNSGTISNAWELKINKIDFITDSYQQGNLRIYTSTDKVHYLSPSYAINSKNLAYYKTYSSRSVLLILDKGSLLIGKNGKSTTELFERNVFFGASEAEKWNSNSRNLFLRSLQWLKAGELIDNDNDGYDSIELGGDDCDDSNSDINPGSSDINKNCKNDAPIINELSPNISKLLKNKETEFRVSITDDDYFNQNLIIKWKINEDVVGEGVAYKFKKDVGNYKIIVSVFDGEFTTNKEWNIEVKDYNEFNCSEINGYTCTENYVCNKEFFSMKDTNVCCSVQCIEKPLTFENINICENKDNKIEVSYDKLNENELIVGNKFNFDIKINNKLTNVQDIEINSYLYDLTNNKILNSKKNSIKIEKESTDSLNVELKIPEDANEDNEFAIYSNVKNENNECNDKYQKINVERKNEHIVIKELDYKDDKYSCGDYVEFEVSLKNLGKETKNLFIKLKSDALGIEEKSENFELEKYGEDDSKRKRFIIKIPDNIKAGDYSIITEAYFNNKVESLEKTIRLYECKETSVKEEKLNIINLIGKSLPISNIEDKENNVNYFVLWLFSLILVFSVVVIYYVIKIK